MQLKASLERWIQSPSLLQMSTAVLGNTTKLLNSIPKNANCMPELKDMELLGKELNTQSLWQQSCEYVTACSLFSERAGLCYLQ